MNTAQTTATTTLTLDEVIADFNQLPPLPRVAMELMDYMQGDGKGGKDVDPEHIAQLLAQDQVLAAKSLRIANSSFYGLSRTISNIHEAITVLGLRTVHTIVTTAAITSMFQALHSALAAAGYDQKIFWRHSVGTAFCARLLARPMHINPETAYTAGLLHDLGYLVLATRFPEHCSRVMAYRNQRDCTLFEAERTVLGFDHTQVGAVLAQRWNFSPEISEAIAWHHAPDEQTARSLASIVHLADIMAHTLNLAEDELPLVPRLSTVVWNRSGLEWNDYKRLLGEVEQQFHDADLLFN